ncbi:MAG: hypothetical protein B6A08_03320 [Sorangiineae bacterium NIC37A_2]|nr:MAG: hypothetical protein B6A08_03320 [Sorangiineae bacterium NIC37A_2]
MSEIGRPAACGPLNTLVCEATPSAALPRRKIIALRLPKSPLFFLAPVHHKRLSPPEPSAELDAPVEPLRASSASGPLIRAPPSLICLRPPHPSPSEPHLPPAASFALNRTLPPYTLRLTDRREARRR